MAKRKRMTHVDYRLEGSKSTVVRLNHRRRMMDESFDGSDCRGSGDVLEASCCSSDGSVGNVGLVDVIRDNSAEEGEININYDLDDVYRRMATNQSVSLPRDMNSAENDSPPPPLPPAKMPSKEEIEAFFAAAEKNLQKENYTEKYNFDFEEEVPLEGRYEWVLVKP